MPRGRFWMVCYSSARGGGILNSGVVRCCLLYSSRYLGEMKEFERFHLVFWKRRRKYLMQ